MKGKEKCKALKEIRRQIAEENDIAFAVSECTHQGDCKGTCPKCEAELRYLERELAIRQGLGKAVAVVGISASVCAGLTACAPIDAVEEFVLEALKDAGAAQTTEGAMVAPAEEPETLDGDIAMPEPTEQREVEGKVVVPEPTEAPVIEIEVETEELLKGEMALPEEGENP